MSQIFPKTFTYNKQTKQLEVEFVDGSITRYFEIDPRSAFLDFRNQARNRDFMAFLAGGRTHKPGCWLEQPNQRACACPLIMSEVIREADSEKLPEPQSRPLLVQQQSGEHK